MKWLHVHTQAGHVPKACLSNAVDSLALKWEYLTLLYWSWLSTSRPAPPLPQSATPQFSLLLTFHNWLSVSLSLLSPLDSMRPPCPPRKPTAMCLTESLPSLGLVVNWIVGLNWERFRKPARSQLSHFQQGRGPWSFCASGSPAVRIESLRNSLPLSTGQSCRGGDVCIVPSLSPHHTCFLWAVVLEDSFINHTGTTWTYHFPFPTVYTTFLLVP